MASPMRKSHIKPSPLADDSMTAKGPPAETPDSLQGNEMTPEGEETPFQHPDQDQELMERKHPNPRVNHLICLISLFELAYGIYMISYSCGDRYIALIVLGIVGLFIGLSSFYRSAIQDSIHTLFYYLTAAYFFVLGIVTLCYLIMIQEQEYCDAQWCHKQVDTQDYFQYLFKQVGQAKLDQKCKELNSKYEGDVLQQAIGQYIVDNMRIYCAREQVCVDSTDLYSKIYWHNIDLTRGLLIVMGVIMIIYCFWIVYWKNVIRPKELEEYEFMMKHDLSEMPNHPLALQQRELYLQKHERWEKQKQMLAQKNKIFGGPTQRSIWAMEDTHTPPNGVSRRRRPGNPALNNPLTVKTKDNVIAPPRNNNFSPQRKQPVFRPVPINDSSPVKPILQPFHDPTRVVEQGNNNAFNPGMRREPNFGDQLIRQQQGAPMDDTQHQMLRTMNRNEFNGGGVGGGVVGGPPRRGGPVDFRAKN